MLFRSGELGEVGNTPVETSDYLRAINQEMRTFEAQTGQNLTAEQARQLGLPQVVQARLFAAAALEDEANRLGVSVGDHVVAEQIRNADAFHGLTGQFDADRYNQVLRSQGLTPASFEHDVRMDQARLILQSAVTDGVRAPQVVAERTAGWLLETRDLAWQELTDADLAAPITPPDEATLRAWHEANGARFTAPETRQITYAWLTPEMLADTVQLDDQALRGIYEQNIAEYQQPERRMVERLVYPDEAEAQAAKAQLDAGQATFEKLANARGLQLTDIDLGEVAKPDLGAAGDPVFALAQPGVVGVHHLHVWQIDERRMSAELHLVVADGDDPHPIRHRVKARLADRFDIAHSTVEIETPTTGCADPVCAGSADNPSDAHHHDYDHDHHDHADHDHDDATHDHHRLTGMRH